MSTSDNDPVVGHKTFSEGHGFRHEPLRRSEADAIMAAAHEADRVRRELMPGGRAVVAERPILFSAPMVRALLAGTKTQTRRVLKAEPPPGAQRVIRPFRDERLQWAATDPHDMEQGQLVLGDAPRCPYGAPGDRLWVRETWAQVPRHEPLTDEDLPWREDGRIVVYAADPEWEGARQFLCADGVMRWAKPEHWRPSIFMPRWASRLTLEVIGISAERLQDISSADAIAEGIQACQRGGEWRNYLDSTRDTLTPRNSYRTLWDSINGAGSWDANPWVWVVEFRRAA